MSKSYKKHPYSGDTKNKYSKKLANKSVRNYYKSIDEDIILSYKDYKKVFQSYSICDYWGYEPFDRWWNDTLRWYNSRMLMEFDVKVPNRQEEYMKWWKSVKGK